MVDITDLGRVLTAMANDLQNRLEGPLLRDDRDVRAVLWPIRHMLTVGASKCAEIAQEQLADAPQSVEASEPEWVRHNSERRPVPTICFVEIERVNGTRDKGYAANFYWGIPALTPSLRINRYRIIDKPEQTS